MTKRISPVTGLLALASLSLSAVSLGDVEVDLDQLNKRWGSDLDNATVTSDEIAPGLYVMRAAGGAIVVSVGDDGVLIVDDQYAKTIAKLQAEIGRLGGGNVDIVLNTHGHFDHADGNPFLGARGAKIIAHENARRQMMRTSKMEYGAVYYMQPPYPREGLPDLTFDDGIRLYYNNHTISLHHFGPGHTDGDAVVQFVEADILHVGDLYSGGYPYIDAGNGGSLAGLIAICRSILDIVGNDTKIVSGHAPVATAADLRDYTQMLEAVHAKLADAASQGQDLDAVMASKPTAEFDAKRGNPGLFITLAYRTVLSEVDKQP